MAAATLTGRQNSVVLGNKRFAGYSAIAFANNGDTWNTGLRSIDVVDLAPTTNTAFGFTVSGATITLVAASGLTFKGGVWGS